MFGLSLIVTNIPNIVNVPSDIFPAFSANSPLFLLFPPPSFAGRGFAPAPHQRGRCPLWTPSPGGPFGPPGPPKRGFPALRERRAKGAPHRRPMGGRHKRPRRRRGIPVGGTRDWFARFPTQPTSNKKQAQSPVREFVPVPYCPLCGAPVARRSHKVRLPRLGCPEGPNGPSGGVQGQSPCQRGQRPLWFLTCVRSARAPTRTGSLPDGRNPRDSFRASCCW